MKKESQDRVEDALFACVVKLHTAMMTLNSERGSMSWPQYNEIMDNLLLIEKSLKHTQRLVCNLAGRDGPEFPENRSD